MARPKEFDRADTLEAALRLFWRKGYAATSLQDLLDEMGIGRSSFYAAFGDKRSLFVEVLTLFADRTRFFLEAAREEVGPLEAVPAFFGRTLLDVPRYRSRRGCMMVNTILELAEVDAELSAVAARELDRVETLFGEILKEAQGSGELSSACSAVDLAAHLMLLNQGLRVGSRKPISRTELKRQLDTALSLVGLPTVA